MGSPARRNRESSPRRESSRQRRTRQRTVSLRSDGGSRAHTKHPSLNCLSDESLSQLLCGKTKVEGLTQFAILDCRFPYEYRGGHIRSAINAWRREDVRKFYDEHSDQADNLVVVFHCEYSMDRAPSMLQYLRDLDRKRHGVEGYPRLSMPHLYVLSGGYRAFYANHKSLCDPQEYVHMTDPNYSAACRVAHVQRRAEIEGSRRASEDGRRRSDTSEVPA